MAPAVPSQGARLYVVSNSSTRLSRTSLEVERWAVYEDDNPLRAWGPAASRLALGAFLAYRSAFVACCISMQCPFPAYFVEGSHQEAGVLAVGEALAKHTGQLQAKISWREFDRICSTCLAS